MKILDKERRLKGMTIAELAKQAGVSQMTVYGWMSGEFVPKASNSRLLSELGFSDTACLEPGKEVDA